MPSKDTGEDVAFFLYLLPVVASIIYGAFEWAILPHTSKMPVLAYVIVAKSQYLFLLSLIAICLAIIFEVRNSSIVEREGVVKANSTRLLWLAIVVLILSLAAAVSAGGYGFGNGFVVFVQGRYPLIYAFFLLGMSLLLSPKQVLGNAKMNALPEILGLVLLVASPLVFYLGLKVKIPFAASAAGGVVVAIIGLVLLLGISTRMGKRSKPLEKPTEQKA